MTIHDWISTATTRLTTAGTSSPRLDAEVLLAHALGQSRTWLIAHQNDNIDDTKVLENASKLLAKRLERVPVAYLTNHKEFYNRSFFVDKRVLIPRPESETIIELLRPIVHDVAATTTNVRLLDVGTGSGILGITAKLEFPTLSVTLSDISEDALAIARKNAKSLGAKPIRFVQSNLLEHWLSHGSPKKFDMILANLPYVDSSWERSPETDHEPSLALFACDNGLELIKKCMQQSRQLLPVGGWLILEADPVQHDTISAYAATFDLQLTHSQDYCVVLTRR